uniref:hypothetical protein n=1 Tax=Paractinoplanes polyasparticus TaxID=2856853 RepID=UPI001C8646B8|nr:hypothetical protein [Actinoplanes polyasparticus]
MTDHLTAETSDRGFDFLPDIPSEYGGHVEVSESSAASGPHIWLRAYEDMRSGVRPPVQAAMHLTAENAWRLAEQLQKLVREHYQGDATPEWAR